MGSNDWDSICQSDDRLAIRRYVMKKFVVIVAAAVALGALVGCLDQGTGSATNKGPLLRYHFAGRANAVGDQTGPLSEQRSKSIPVTFSGRPGNRVVKRSDC